ncbi:hypothetical protein Acr_00g0043910 [Actinidia rufa]|uniref:Uncharacterized protein n=1 Tax=Actinidia rufa TaxID=165716 RepID=A0A7J0DIS1_9ERIC|nr:hypothetical protein Acr_00g0043910 [Actinidia rufa]
MSGGSWSSSLNLNPGKSQKDMDSLCLSIKGCRALGFSAIVGFAGSYNGCFPMLFHSYEPKMIQFRHRTLLLPFGSKTWTRRSNLWIVDSKSKLKDVADAALNTKETAAC